MLKRPEPEEKEEEYRKQYLPGCEQESKLDLSHLSEDHQQELCSILCEGIFMEKPGRTELVEHPIVLRDEQPVRQPSYWVPECLLPRWWSAVLPGFQEGQCPGQV